VHDLSNLGPRIIMSFGDGSVYITETVFFGMIVGAILIILALWSTHRMEKYPKGKQVVAEFIVEAIYKMTTGTMGKSCSNFAPYIGTLFIFLLLGNALGLFGFRPVTADVNMTFALALITFILIHYNSVKSMGWKGKLKHMASPYPFMFLLSLIESISKPISLGFRLFGNILGGVIVMALVFTGLGAASDALHLPIPLLQAVIPLPVNAFFDIFEPVVQAYIFTMLTMIFISLEMAVHSDNEDH